MSAAQLTCPQCSEPTDTLHEGYCAECCEENQSSLDAHNFQHDRWQRLSDSDRAAEIKQHTR